MTMGMFFWVKKVVPALIVAADGSGDFDNIQSAIDALPVTGGNIFIKPGTYTLSSKILVTKNNVSIYGSGKSTKITTTSLIILIEFDTVSDCVIEQVYIYGGDLNESRDGVSLKTSSNCTVRNCWIKNCGEVGIIMRVSSFNNYILNNVVECGTLTGITTIGYNNMISGNVVKENGTHGIALGPLSHHNSVINNIVKDNDVNNTASYDGISFGVGVSGSDDNIVAGNICSDNDRYEINILNADCERNIVEGNVCIGTDHVGAINDSGTNTQLGHNITS